MMKCRFNCGTDIVFEDHMLGPRGRKIPLHLDGTIHNCPNSPYSKRLSQLRPTQPQENQQPESTIVTADKLLEEKRINNLRLIVDGWKGEFHYYEPVLVIKEKGVD
jgi:hypothetical protein